MKEKSLEEIRFELLIKAKTELIEAMRLYMEPANQIAAALILEADNLKPSLLDDGFRGRVRRIVYKETPTQGEGINKDKEEPGKPIVPVGRRTCSICRKPGHRAPSCPERG